MATASMLLRWLLIVSTILLLCEAAPQAADELIMVQVIWRHGDRSPTMTFKNDPNQESAWPLGWGQLTPIGMEQHMILGNLLYERYVQNLTFLDTSLKFNQMYVRTTDVNRTYISAYSNLFGMYYGRTESKPGVNYPNNPRWPGQLVPFPVHANVEYEEDHVGNPLAYCPRREWLWSKAKETPEMTKVMNENQNLLNELTQLTGSNITIDNLWYVRDAIFIEQIHKKPTLINDTLYKRIDHVVDLLENYEDGLDLSQVDGIDFKVEIPKVRGGATLWAIINNFDLKLFCYDPKNEGKPQCRWMKNMKYYAFSAHDNTISALMSTLGAKEKLVPTGYPSYSACLAFELWDTAQGPSIRMLYHNNASTGFEVATKTITGCENLTKDKCKYSIIRENANTFYPGQPESVLCQDLTSPKTDMWNTTARPGQPTTGPPLQISTTSGAIHAFTASSIYRIALAILIVKLL